MNNLIFFKTTADFDNTGEVLIYKSLINYLRCYGDVIISDSSNIQPLFLDRIGIKDNERLSTHTGNSFIIYLLKKCITNRNRIWLVSGVGDHKISGINGVLKNIISFLFIILLRIMGAKVLRIGMSIRFGGKLEEFSEKLLSSVINFYYVRDSISFENCKVAGISNCKVAPDLSWGYQIQCDESQDKRHYVIFSFRDYFEKQSQSKDYKKKIEGVIATLIEYLSEKSDKYTILFTYQCPQDYKFMSEIRDTIRNYNISVVGELVTLENAHKYYGNALFILSNRLHVILLGYKYGSPTLCLSDIKKHSKIKGILSDNGLDELFIDINQQPSAIVNRLASIISHLKDVEKKYKIAEIHNRGILDSTFKGIFE